MYKYKYEVREATGEHVRWTGMKHFERKIMLQYLFLWNKKFNQEGFLQQLMGAPISQPKLNLYKVCVAAAQAGTPRTQERLLFFLYRQIRITQEFDTKSTPECLTKYLQQSKSTLGAIHNHETGQAHIYTWKGMFIRTSGVKAGWWVT